MSAEIWTRVEKVADYLGIPDATVRTWKSRGFIPPARHKDLLATAKEKKIRLKYEELTSIQ